MNNTQNSNHRIASSGFTLVELSIALVIIGLLVGGILSFGTFTKNARMSTMMNESKTLISAFSQFQTRYGVPPGDMSTASASWAGAGNGDGNGVIRAGATAQPLERYYAFQHLALAGFIQGTYTGVANPQGGATVGVNVVGGAVDNSAFIFDHPDAEDGFVDSTDTLYFEGVYGNILRVAGLNPASANIPALGLLAPKDAMSLDIKFDDGQPGTGNLLTPEGSALANCASSDVATSAVYTVSNDSKTCYFFMRMQ